MAVERKSVAATRQTRRVKHVSLARLQKRRKIANAIVAATTGDGPQKRKAVRETGEETKLVAKTAVRIAIGVIAVMMRKEKGTAAEAETVETAQKVNRVAAAVAGAVAAHQ